MKNKVIFGIVGLVMVVSIIYSLSGGLTEEQYAEELKEHREESDRFMRYSDESPFKGHVEDYKGLNYYAASLKYKIKARFVPVAKPEIITLQTSDNKEIQYLTYGHAEFKIDGQDNRLLLLENVEDQTLFLAFGDSTSAIETYGAGRYLDVTHNGGTTVELDFNKAYNPYCAYSDGYSCPLPPRQNLLHVAIKAGEKNYPQE